MKKWRLLGDAEVNTVLFVTEKQDNRSGNERRMHFAHQLGWDIMVTTDVNEEDTPIMKGLYAEAHRHFTSVFYGYCNGNILFDDGLIKTLTCKGSRTTSSTV